MPAPASTSSSAVLDRISGSTSSIRRARSCARDGRPRSWSARRWAPGSRRGGSTGVSPPRKSAGGNVVLAALSNRAPTPPLKPAGGYADVAPAPLPASPPDCAASVLSVDVAPAEPDCAASLLYVDGSESAAADAGTAMHDATTMVATTRRCGSPITLLCCEDEQLSRRNSALELRNPLVFDEGGSPRSWARGAAGYCVGRI